jgi:exonuclease V gamma subunit
VEVQVAGTVVAGVLTEGADKQRLVLMNPSKLDRPAVLLQAYAHAALAAAGLRPMAMDLLVRDGEAFVTKALPAVEAEAGRAWLQAVLGLRAQRQGHPPCFAPATSLALAKAQAEADKKERPLKLDDAFDKAHKQWDEESDFNEAEGLSPAALLAWRGRGALDEDLWNAWLEAANAIWGPVLAWSDAKAGGAA